MTVEESHELGKGEDVKEDTSESIPNEEDSIILETGPLLKPTILLMFSIIVTGVILIGAIFTDPDLVGGPTIAEIVVNAILILVVIILLRYLVKLIILDRMTYIVHDDGFQIEYTLFYRRYARELPVEELRGKEYERGRFETLFGCATIRLLTGGTDRSIGFIEFKSVREPKLVNNAISQVRQNHEKDN